MDRQVVEFVQHKERISYVPLINVYRLNPKLGYRHLQRLAGWFLTKIGAQYLHPEMTVERIVFSKRAFADALLQQYHDVMSMHHPDRPVELFIGPEEFRKLTGANEFRQLVEFTTSINYGDPYGIRVLGMRVTVVPWMSGVLVVPQRG